MNTRYLLAVLLVAVISVTSAHDREKGRSPPIPAADHAAIRNYSLNDDVVRRLLAVSADAEKAHVGETWVFAQLYADSLDDITDRVLTTQPRLARIVERHGFTRREYMIAAFALASARQVALYGPDEKSAAILRDQFVSSANASAANIAFYESHSEQLEPHLAGGPVTQHNVKRATE
jgi:hypothetical protein